MNGKLGSMEIVPVKRSQGVCGFAWLLYLLLFFSVGVFLSNTIFLGNYPVICMWHHSFEDVMLKLSLVCLAKNSLVEGGRSVGLLSHRIPE